MIRAGMPSEIAGREPVDPVLAAIVEEVRSRRGTDFGVYRLETVRRRVLNRAVSAGAATLQDYLARLRSEPGEVGELVQRLTIKVSRFYRNPEHVPAVRAALAARAAATGRPLRAWSAGCGRGEEAYTLAMLLAEVDSHAAEGQVIGTDIDPAALRAAAAACYPGGAVADLPPELAHRYLEEGGGSRRVRDALRARVRFQLHDLTRAAVAPACGLDLVACRNTLIYFRPEVHASVERLLLRGLAPGGLLWLGEAEWPSAESIRRLEVVDRRVRLFRARPEGARA